MNVKLCTWWGLGFSGQLLFATLVHAEIKKIGNRTMVFVFFCMFVNICTRWMGKKARALQLTVITLCFRTLKKWIPDIRYHGHSFPCDFWQGRTFVLTSNDHPGHSCSHQMTTPDIRAHIKLPPRTFMLTSNDHPDIRAHINLISFIYSLHAYPLLLIAWGLKKSTNEQVKV